MQPVRGGVRKQKKETGAETEAGGSVSISMVCWALRIMGIPTFSRKGKFHKP
jgi:hypothetical protein